VSPPKRSTPFGVLFVLVATLSLPAALCALCAQSPGRIPHSKFGKLACQTQSVGIFLCSAKEYPGNTNEAPQTGCFSFWWRHSRFLPCYVRYAHRVRAAYPTRSSASSLVRRRVWVSSFAPPKEYPGKNPSPPRWIFHLCRKAQHHLRGTRNII